MRTLKKNWGKFAGAAGFVGLAVIGLYACLSAWGQTAPALSITLTASNQVAMVVTNGTNTGNYQIFFKDSLDSNQDWSLFTNGSTGQTNFTASIGNTEIGFFKATTNTNGGSPFTLTVIIQSPTNGAVVY